MNPINPAIDKLLFTADIDQVYEMMSAAYKGGEPWVVWGAEMVNGQRTWMLGRISAERVKSLPDFLPLYKNDFPTTLSAMIRNGIPIDPPICD